MKSPQWNSLWAVVSLLALLISAPSAQAQTTSTWTGATGADWGTSGSWSGTDKPPLAADTALFNTAGTILVNNLLAAQSITNITFDTSAGTFTIGTTGGDALDLQSGGQIQIAATIAASKTETINAPLVLEGANGTYTFANNSSGSTLNFGGGITGGAAGATVLTLSSSSTASNTISGVIGNGSATTVALNVSGLWKFTAADTYSGATTVSAGVLTLGSTSGGGSVANSAVTLDSNATLAIVDSSTSGSLTRASSVTADGGLITVTGSTVNSNDTITTLTLNPGYVSQPTIKLASSGSTYGVGGGDNTIVVTPGAANTLLTIGTLSRNAGGTVEFTTNSSTVSLGTDTIASATAGQVNIAITNAPTLVGGGGALSTTTTSIIPFAVGASTASVANAPTDFVTYTAANGVQLLTNYTNTFATSVATSNLKELTADSISTTTTVNSLAFSSTNTLVMTLNSQTLNVTSGAVLFGTGNAETIGVAGGTAGTLNLGTGGEAFIEGAAARIDIINAAITGPTAGLTITGPNVNNSASTIIFAGANTYSGGTIVNGGGGTGGGAILQIGGTAAATAGATGQLGSGAVTLNDATLAFNLTVNQTVANNIGSSVGSGLGIVSTRSSDTGIITLSGTNTYAGGTTINGGTLQFANYGAMPGTGTVTVASGGTLGVNAGGGGTEWTNGTSGAGTIGGLFAGLGGSGQTVTLNSGSAVGIDTTNAGGSLTYSGNITGAPAGVGLTKLGTGTLILSGNSTYTGTTTAKVGTLDLTGSLTGLNVATTGTGTLMLSNTAALGSSATVTMSGGTVDLATNTSVNSFNIIVNSLSTGTIAPDLATAGAGITQQLGTLQLGSGTAFGGTLSVAQGANVTSGTGTVAFGAVTLDQTGGSSALSVTSGALTVGNVTPISTANAVTLDLDGTGGTGSITGVIGNSPGGGVLNIVNAASGTNVWTLSGANTYTGGTSFTIAGTMVAANVQAFGVAGAALEVGNADTVDLATDTTVDAWNTTVTLTAGQTATIESDKATPSSAGITQTLGTLSLSGSATTAATLNVKSGANVSGGTPIVAFGATTLTSTATATSTLNPTTAGMTMTTVTGSATATHVDTLSLGGSATDNAITGAIANGSGGGTVAVTSNGTGVWVLSGTNTYTGGTAVTSGTLQIGNGSTGALDASSTYTFGATGTLAFDEANNAAQAGNIAINTSGGTVAGNEGTSITNTLSGQISGTGGQFAQNGAGTTILSNTDTYTGATNVNAGTLYVSGKISASAVAVNNGGTLAGAGNGTTTGVISSSVTVVSGGNINLVDNSIGTLTVGSLSTTAGNLTFEIGTSTGSIDKIASGALTIGSGTTTINIDNLNNAGSQTLANGAYTLLTYTGTASGSLSNFALSAPSMTLDGKSLTLSTATTGSLILTVGNLVTTTSTTYNLTAAVADARVLQFGQTTVTATITNVGTGTADALDYTGLTTNGSLSGGTLPQSGGPLPNATNAVSGNNSASGMATLTVGPTTGNVTITPTVSSATNDTLATAATPGTVTTATVDVVAQRTINNGAATDLGTLHNGATVSATTAANPFNSTGTHVTTTDVSVAGGDGSPDGNGVTLSGGTTTFDGATSGVVNGTTQTFGGTITNNSGGTTTGEFDLAVNTLENGGAGLDGEGPYDDVLVDYTANVYTGLSTWSTNGGGTWGTLASNFGVNWGAGQGSPGLDSGFTDTDTATFDNSVLTPGDSATVTLDGANPSLLAITFNTQAGSGYTLAPGSGGTITLNGGGGAASVTVTSGTHVISAPVSLATNANVDIASGQQLTISGAVSGIGTGLTTTDSGTLVLSSTNTYSGATAVNAGTLSVTGSIANSAVSVANGATLSGTGSTGAVAVAGGGNINLQDGAIGTLTVAGLSSGNATTPSAFSFDIQTVLGTTSTDLIADSGTLTLTGAGGTTISIGALSGTTSLTNGNYDLLTYTGTQQSLANLNLLTPSLDGSTLSLGQTGDTIYLIVSSPGGSATTAYFNGAGSDMGTAANFDTGTGTNTTGGSIAPTTNIFFSADANTNHSATLSAPLEVNSVNFGAGAGVNSGITVSGSSALQIDATNVNGNTGNNGISITGSGSDTISAPVALGGSQTWTTASGSKLTVSGQVSGTGYSLTKAGAGTVVLSNPTGNTYSGGTTISNGKLYVNNTSNSGTGTGSVLVQSGGTLAGSGIISGPVTVQSGGTLASGGVQTSDATHDTVTGTGLTADLAVNGGATLQFDLGAGASTGAYNFASPNLNSTYLTSTGPVAFGTTGGAVNINLVDLTAFSSTATLQLRYQNPYLLIAASSGLDSSYDLVTTGGYDQNGYVLGIGSSDTGNSILNTFNLSATDINGAALANPYNDLQLYLYNGDLEVVPEPGTWALMLGGLALLVFVQSRRRLKV